MFEELLKKIKTQADISYDKYIKFTKMVEAMDESNVFQPFAFLFDVDESDLRKLKATEYEQLSIYIGTILQETHPITFRFKLDNVEYGLIPDFTKITTAELIDLDTSIAHQNIPGVLSILYRPIVKKQWNPYNIFGKNIRYTITEYTEPHQKFAELPVSVVNPVLTFFLTFYQNLS